MILNPRQLVAQEKLMRWKAEPVAFVREELHAEPDEWQAEALMAFPEAQRLAIGAAKGPGKTAVESWLGWLFMLTRPHARVPCTSISGENLSSCLWSEFATWRKRSKLLEAEFVWTASKIFQKQHADTWFAEARAWPKSADATQQANTLAGYHADYIFFILDEAGGIPDAVAAAAEGALATGIETKMLICGNKTHLSGPLYRAHTSERHLWRVIEVTGDPDDPKRSPRIGLKWAREQIEKYGRDNDWVKANVLNQFPSRQSNTWIGIEDVDGAANRNLDVKFYAHEPKILGVDVSAGGDNESVITPRQGDIVFPSEVELGQPDTMKLVAHVALVANVWGADAIFVDGNGVGRGVADRLRELGYNATAVDSASESFRQDVRFFNLRAQMWWDMAQWLRHGAIPKDDTLRSQLMAPTYSFDPRGRYKLETKDEMKRRGVNSPDRADSLAYTFAFPVARRLTQAQAQSRDPMAAMIDRLAGNAPSTRCATDFDPFAGDGPPKQNNPYP